MISGSADRRVFEEVKRELIDRTGHHYYADKDSQLAERIARRIADTGSGSVAGYHKRLRGADGEVEWRLLESAVTINETFFFRFADQFEALRTAILPTLIRERNASRRLRIWSAGCSTGAEAYSIAVLVHDLLGPALADWTVSILGTDIDEAALQAAREGRYGAWALRTLTDERTRERLFVREGQHWVIRPAYRALARFERHNLLSVVRGTGALQMVDYDLILCRNVLIYFSEEQARATANALGACLAPDGWMLLGHAEPQPDSPTLAPVQVERVLAWRPAANGGAAAIPEPEPVPAPVLARTAPRAPRPRPHASPIAPSVEAADTAASDLRPLREALAAGLLDRAAALGEAATSAAPEDPTAHFLSALALAGLGRHDEAEGAFGRALYLDGDFAMAHYLAAVHQEERGRRARAQRGYANAVRALVGRADDDAVPEGEGLTVADLVRSLRWRVAAAG